MCTRMSFTGSAPESSDPNKQPGSFFVNYFRMFFRLHVYHSSEFRLIVFALCLIHVAKKQTRQWAAWTHQEEENFFNALRQVGKVRGIISGYNALLLFAI